ncbi:TRM11 family SAM-dependent methyltransferase [Nanoarchaeota archaeon]
MKFELLKDNIELAAAEVLALAKVKDYSLKDNVLEIGEDIPGLDKRLALTKKIIIGGRELKISKKELMNRRTHFLPGMHPASTVPKLARAMVNLTGASDGDLIVDPFCGAAGILIEAALMGFKIVGYDIDEVMLERARKNLDYFKIKDYKLEKKDATTVNYKGYIIADLPYGLNTKVSEEVEELYLKFFKRLNKVKKAIIGLPDFVDCDKLIKESKLKIEQEFTWYLHKNLSKKIIITYPESP